MPLLIVFLGCVGEFTAGSPVSGLSYKSDTRSGKTDADGAFEFEPNEKITFSIGDLVLGETTVDSGKTSFSSAKVRVSPYELVAGGSGAGEAVSGKDPAAVNIAVLLQALDQDGHLNNGIRITPKIAAIVGKYEIDFNQSAADFAEDTTVAELMAELNAAGVFNDTDPRDRTLAGAAAAEEQLDRSLAERHTVRTQYGALQGFAADEKTWQYLGVPYGNPPIGELRWRPTKRPAAWRGVRYAFAWGDQAAQDPTNQAYGEGGMSEDCLYLNVTAPKDADGLPVMVWYHGGAFTILTGNTKGYNNIESLTTKEVVLVTVTHRLGPFGYLSHPLLAEEARYGGSGNYGQMDLVAALQWVKGNIEAFGGDPDNVTIFGQSGGGGKVVSLMMSPLAKGLFHKAICMAGTTALDPASTVESSISNAEAIGEALFTRLGAASLKEARALPWTDIVQADIDNDIPRETYRPSIDHYYLSDTYYNTLQNGQPGDVPLLIGATAGDYPHIIAGVKDQVPFRSAHSNADLFVYKFNRVPSGWSEMGLLSNHGGEIPYLFNSPSTFVNNYMFQLIVDPATGGKPEIGDFNGNGITGTDGDTADIFASMAWNAEDVSMVQTTISIWTNFAKTGNPSAGGITWPAYTEENDAYVEIGPTALTVKSGLDTAFP